MNRPELPPWRVGSALLTGALVVLAFPLFGSEMGLEGLIWVALVPLFLSATGVGGRRGFVLGVSAGSAIEAAGFIWILVALRRFTELPSILTSLGFLVWVAYSTVPWALLGLALGKCSRPSGVLWVLPFWVGLEHHFPRLFPWHLGGALHSKEWLLQTVDVWGASGLTVLVFLSSACAYFLILRASGRGRFPWGICGSFVVILGAGLVYGRLRLDDVLRFEARSRAFRVVCIQGALDPRTRSESSLEYYKKRTAALLSKEKVDLVVWPEGSAELVLRQEGTADSVPCFFDLDPADPLRARRRFADLGKILESFVQEISVPLVCGGWGIDAGRSPPISNVLAYAEPTKPVCFYEKNVRVPFGEVVPLLELVPLGLRRRLGIQVATIAAGRTQPLFRLGGVPFGNLICYEATLPYYVPRVARGADFLVNITEDVWYGRTAHIPQHVSVLRLRVVENRTPLVRCTNVGPSGVVDISGRFHRGERIFEPEEVLGTLHAGSMHTLYQKIGRFLPTSLLLVAGLRGLFLVYRRYKGRGLPAPVREP